MERRLDRCFWAAIHSTHPWQLQRREQWYKRHPKTGSNWRVHQHLNPSIGRWFNTAAFVAPPTDQNGNTLQYGNARRNSIIGPGSHVADMAFTKLFPLKESRV